MDKRVAELVLEKCLGRRGGESVLIVTDTSMEHVGADFHRAAAAVGIDATLMTMMARAHAADEPTPAIAEALKHCQIAVLLTSASMTHTRARREASERHRVRIASMPGISGDRLEHLLAIDYDDLAARCSELARLLEGPHRIHLSTPAGTDLTFEVGNRPVFRDTGDMRSPGSFGSLPCGAVVLPPLEGTARGVAMIDGSIAGFGLCDAPVKIEFDQGRAVRIADAGLTALLRRHGELAFNLGGFGIGMNPHAEIVGSLVEDSKAQGVVHIAIGDSASIGGVVSVPVHIGAVMLDAKVEIDGHPLQEKWLASRKRGRPSASGPLGLDVTRSDTYRALFEQSYDPQYVLDLATQRFLEVNPSFERLTGFSRDELLSGQITAPKLVAQESHTTFQQKMETRRLTPSERYDIKVLCRDGSKKPVEVSVKRMVMEGRDVVLGAVRDLSAQKRLEQEMWEKIQELGFASNRILALTEKIRKVPEFTPKLLSITDEHELLERATEMLCSRDGLGYADVTFYLVNGDSLELSYSNTSKTRKRRTKLTTDSRLVHILRGEEPPSITKHDALLPLKGRERNIGVIEVSFHPKEIEVLAGNERALKGYQDLLETMSSMIGLLVENLHLYETVRLQSIIDPLTSAYNRRFFDQRLADEIQRAARYSRSLSLLLIDVDHFKRINDTMSYKEGDLVLTETAKLFRTHTREVDFVCRIGGDEFAVILPETTYEQGLAKAELLRREVAAKDYENVMEPSKPVKVTLSIGVSAYTNDVHTSDDLLATVDESIHAAKRAGRDTVCGALPKESQDPKPDRTTKRFQAPT